MDLSKGMQEVIAERKRQISDEGFGHSHDLQHDPGELAGAGASYAMNAAHQLHPQTQLPLDEAPGYWLWGKEWWKPGTPRRDLVKAAALLIAEIDRMDAAEALGIAMPLGR